ncbi:MAG: phosphatidylserine decarboxylase family protein [Bacteroidota bacterium]
MTTISKYGFSIVSRILGLALVANLLVQVLVVDGTVKTAVLLISILFTFFVLYFFRDPARISPVGDHLILSPADGKIVHVGSARDPDFLDLESIQISIFLSPLDVHVNRIPISGKVRHLRYVRGEYLVAFHEKASQKNERTVIGIDNGKFKVLMRQVAGFVARRIVCNLKVDDDVKAGERFGMIKFGSRVDVLVPTQADIKVDVDDRVVAGETVLAVCRT